MGGDRLELMTNIVGDAYVFYLQMIKSCVKLKSGKTETEKPPRDTIADTPAGSETDRDEFSHGLSVGLPRSLAHV